MHPSENRITKLRHLRREYNMHPCDWDSNYDEEMIEKRQWYPEDVNALVQIDSEIALEIERIRNANKNNSFRS